MSKSEAAWHEIRRFLRANPCRPDISYKSHDRVAPYIVQQSTSPCVVQVKSTLWERSKAVADRRRRRSGRS